MKTLQSLLLTCLVSFTSLAGTNLVIKPNFGIGLTHFSKEIEGYENQLTLGTEYGLDFLVGRKIYLQSGVRYIKDSYRVSGKIQNFGDVESKIHNIGIKVPVHLGLYLVDMEATNLVKARIFMGPSFKATTTIDNEGDQILERDDFSDVTMGYEVGVGIDIWKIFIEAGYELGLNAMIKEHDIKSNGAYITTGFLIRIK